MKNRILIIILVLNFSFVSCQNSNDRIWKSKVSDLELVFNNQWKLIKPFVDNNNKILVGLTDQTDHSSLTVKITKDLPKDQVSDELYFGAIKEQMLNANSKNELITEDIIEFKETQFQRLIFSMVTKFGEMTHTVYTHRNGEKVIGIQFTYPKKPIEKIPPKIEKLLSVMKI